MKNIYGKNVLVTGATSGIGKCIADRFASNGCNVIGIGLKCEEKKISLGSGTIEYISVDVTDDKALDEVFKNKIKDVDVAVLCAGFGIAGPAEIMPMEYVRRQMEVNYFGVINMCNRILPIMREKRKGLVIAISSVAGRITLPMQCHYSSSKYALEAYLEAVRIEMRDFNVKTVLIEPGDTKTGFTKARKTYNPEGNPYYDVCKRSVDKQAKYEIYGKSPETVADVAIKMVSKKNPPIRVAVGVSYKLACFLIRLLPSKFIDYILYKIYMPTK